MGLGIVTLNGCKSKLLPETSVPATKENKSIVDFLSAYKNAMEKRSPEAVMDLVAVDFSDNAGTDDPQKFLDYISLKEKLEKYFPTISELRVGFYVQHVERLEKNKFRVVFQFNTHALVKMNSGNEWISKSEVNSMVIRKRTDRNAPLNYEIISGI